MHFTMFFTVYFDQINAALVRIIDFFKELLLAPNFEQQNVYKYKNAFSKI